MELKDLNLTPALRSISCLSEVSPKPQDAYSFDAVTDRSAVKSVQLSADAVGTSSLADNSVTTAKIANSAVTSAKIASNAVTQTDIDGSAIFGTHISNGAIAAANIGGSIIAGTHISNGGVVAANLAGSVIVGTHIALNAITNNKINDYDLGKGTGNINAAGGTLVTPRVTGTPTFDTNAGSAALGVAGDFAIQTHSGSAILVARLGTQTFYFTSAGTL